MHKGRSHVRIGATPGNMRSMAGVIVQKNAIHLLYKGHPAVRVRQQRACPAGADNCAIHSNSSLHITLKALTPLPALVIMAAALMLSAPAARAYR